MKSLSQHIREEVSISLGDTMANSTFATPGNTMGIGNVKPPSLKEPGSGDIFGTTRKERPKNKKKKREEN